MVDKKGQVIPSMRSGGILVAMVVITVIITAIVALVYEPGESIIDPKSVTPIKFGDAIGQPELNWVSYIAGGIPDFLIEWTNPISASIIILALFAMLFVVFSDILGMFGTFSSQSISYLIGFILALIAANLKLLMYMAVWAMFITSGLGILGAAVGIAVPFIIFIVIHVMLGANFWKHRKDMKAFKAGADELAEGITGIKAFGKAVRGGDDGTIPHR